MWPWRLRNPKIFRVSQQARDPSVFLVQWLAGLRPSKSQCFSLSLKAGKSRCPSVKAGILTWGSAFLFYSGLQLIEWSAPTSWKTICFAQSTDLNVNLIQKYPHRNTQNNVWPNNWSPGGPVKLTRKINHHGSCLQGGYTLLGEDKQVK